MHKVSTAYVCARSHKDTRAHALPPQHTRLDIYVHLPQNPEALYINNVIPSIFLFPCHHPCLQPNRRHPGGHPSPTKTLPSFGCPSHFHTHLPPLAGHALLCRWKDAAAAYLEAGGKLLEQLQCPEGCCSHDPLLSEVARARGALEGADGGHAAALDALEVSQPSGWHTNIIVVGICSGSADCNIQKWVDDDMDSDH